MKKHTLHWGACALLALGAAVGGPALHAAPMTIGTNLAGTTPSSAARAYIDVLELLGEWKTKNQGGGGPWDTGHIASAARDANGWVTTVPFTVPGVTAPQYIHSLVDTNLPAGTYVLSWQGVGDFRLQAAPAGNGNVIRILPSDTPGTRTFTLTAPAEITLEIFSTGGANYLRDFNLVPQDLVANYAAGERIRPAYIADRANYPAFRFMDWVKTNHSIIEEWSQRPKANYFSQSAQWGQSYESMIELSNRAQVDLWVCVPHRASDDYVRQFARFLRDNASPHLRIYLEYSNEVWNGTFSQNAYAKAKGFELGLHTTADHVAAARYTAHRSLQIFKMFEEEFGAQKHRLLKVFATQGGNTGILNEMLKQADLSSPQLGGIWPDYVSGAPYFGGHVVNQLIAQGLGNTATVDQVIAAIDASVQEGGDRVRWDAITGAKKGLAYVAYEGGQHVVAGTNTHLQTVVTQAQRDPRMFGIYTRYLDIVAGHGAERFMHFNDVGGSARYGWWGAKVFEGQSIDPAVANFAPKAAAIAAWQEAHAPLLSEEFRDGDSAGWTVTGSGAAWSVVQGRLRQANNADWSLARWTGAGSANWTNYRFETEVTNADDDLVGVAFRVQNANNYYRFMMDTYAGNSRRLERVVNGVATVVQTATGGYTVGTTHHVEVVADGSSITVKLDGVDVFGGPVTDATFATGSVGLVNRYQQGVFYDNVVVSPLN